MGPDDPHATQLHPPGAGTETSGGAGESSPTASFRPSDAADFLDPAVKVAGYEILGVLGRGGMGVVYKAKHLALNRVVALKMILSGSHAGSDERSRFKAEAAAVARLQHANIVQIHEVGEADGLPYCALEFVEGGSLAQKLAGRPLLGDESARIVEALARAMQLAHSRNVVHRDLKPANVLMGSDGTPKVSDFGLARHLDVDSGQTQLGDVLGTPSYMAPEQARGLAHAAGPAADIYSLGAILYQCLTGRPPFRGATKAETLEQVRSQEPAAPRALQPQAPLDLETICLKCLRKEPELRYASAEALADDLRRWRSGEPIAARPVGSAERAWMWVRRHPARTGLIASVLLLLVAVTVFSFVVALQQHQAAYDLGAYNKNLLHEQKGKEKALKDARRSAVRLALDNGLIHCEQGEVGRGLVALARALVAAVEAEEADLESAIRFNLAAWSRSHWPLRKVVQPADGSYVSTAVLAPRADLLAAALSNNNVQLSSTASGDEGRVLHTLPHEGPVWTLAFSADGRRLLSATSKLVRVWNVADGQLASAPLPHASKVWSAAISPDGKLVLTGADDKLARLWDADAGKPARSPPWPHAHRVTLASFSPDGSLALTASPDGSAHLWTVATALPAGPPLVHATAVTTATFSPDGARLFTGTSAGKLHQWQTATAKPAHPPVALDGSILATAVSADGKRLAVRCNLISRTVHLLNAENGLPIVSPLPHPEPIESMAFSADGQLLLSGGANGTARFWSAASGGAAGSPLSHQGAVRACAFSNDGRTLLTVDGTVRLWGRPDGVRRGPFLKHGAEVRTLAFRPDGERLLTGSLDQSARLWDTATGAQDGASMKNGFIVRAVAFSPDGKRFCTASSTDARFWKAGDSAPSVSLRHPAHVYSLQFNRDGKRLLTGSESAATLWDLEKGQELASLGHCGIVQALAVHPGGRFVLTGSADTTARLWDVASDPPSATILPHEGPVEAVAFSRDGQIAFTADNRDALIHLWQVPTGAPLRTLAGHQGGVKTIAVSPDGTMLLSGGNDKAARLWNVATAAPLGPPMQHQDLVRAVAFSPDGRTLLTGSYDGTARRWHAPTALPIGPAFVHGKIAALVASPKGDLAATASFNGTAALWETPPALAGSAADLALWAQVVTGLELDDDGALRFLDASAWQRRRDRLGSFFP